MVGEDVGERRDIRHDLSSSYVHAGHRLCEGIVGRREDGEVTRLREGIDEVGGLERRNERAEFGGRDGEFRNRLGGGHDHRAGHRRSHRHRAGHRRGHHGGRQQNAIDDVDYAVAGNDVGLDDLDRAVERESSLSLGGLDRDHCGTDDEESEDGGDKFTQHVGFTFDIVDTIERLRDGEIIDNQC